MQISTDRSVLDRIPAERKANYHINPDATIHITRILRNMYQDPVRAVVREYVSNSIDVHRQFGVKKPIEVALPSRFTQEFRVRDFGPGLSEEEVEKFLLGYGSSGDHKRTSNEQIGGFGIGCKCAFAVSDTFTYTSWHGGNKQVWLCQLDDKDMGEAKLISKEPSNEPTGLQIQIPVRDSQLGAFEKQTKLALRFIDVPIEVDGVVRKPDSIYDIRLNGPLNGDFKGSQWEFLKFQDGQDAPDLLAVMGDMWYPIDPAQVKGLDTSKLQKVLKGDNNNDALACAFRVPIGSLSIAPTREGLQYDAHTCKSLKHLVSDVDRVLQDQAEMLIEKEASEFSALDKAFEMMHRKVFTFPRDPQRGPFIKWNGRKLFLAEAFSVKAEPHSSGCRALLMTRDSYEKNGGRTRGWYSSTPVLSKLATHEVELTAPHAINSYPASSIAMVNSKDGLVTSRPTAYSRGYSYSSSYTEGKSIPIIVYAPKVQKLIDGRKQEVVDAAEAFIFTRTLKLYKTIKGVPSLHYARKLLKARADDPTNVDASIYAPYDDGMFIVLEGSDAEIEAFLKAHPWMAPTTDPAAIEELPVAESALKRARRGLAPKVGQPSVRKRPNYELFKFDAVNSTSAPSENWERVPKSDIPMDDYTGVFMSRMNPVPCQKQIDGVTPSSQFNWLVGARAAMELLTGKKPEIYGIRLYQTHKPKVPDEFISFYDALRKEIDKWLDPSTLGNYAVHGTQLMLRFGHNNHVRMGKDAWRYREMGDGLFSEFKVEADKYPLMHCKGQQTQKRNGYGYHDGTHDHQVHLIDCVRIPESWQLIQRSCRPDSELVKWGQLLEKHLGPANETREAEFNKWRKLLGEFATASAWVTPRDDHEAVYTPTEARLNSMKAHYAPVQAGWQHVWDHYSCLRLFEDVPVEGKDLRAMMDYINVIDAQ